MTRANLYSLSAALLATGIFVSLPAIAQEGSTGSKAPITKSTEEEVQLQPKSDNQAEVDDKAATPSAQTPSEKRKAELDKLFADLKRTPKRSTARATERKIWALWNESGSETIDALMGWAGAAMNDQRYNVAHDLLDQVIALEPGYAEGWNRRATMFYQRRQFGNSISDIEQTLKLEPRHFGALSGLAAILQILDQKEKALQTWYKVLEIYPASPSAQKAVIELEEELAGEPT